MLSVLYVDDEQDLLDPGRIFLEQSGEFRVGTVTSAQGALESPFIRSCDAIISDFQMPGMDGIAFLKEVRARYGDLPFILFTGRGREEVVIAAINNGADFYIQKGGDPKAQFAELAHKVRQAVARRQAERLRTESEKRLSDIINFLPDATFAIDKSGTVIAWNRAIEEMTGTLAADLIGRKQEAYSRAFYQEVRPMLIDLVLAPDEQFEKDNYVYTARDGTTLTAETILERPQKPPVHLWGKASRLFDEDGNLTGAIESIRDITERKKAEEALRESEERYRSIVNDQTEMIVRFNPDGLITFTNEAFRSVFLPKLGLDEVLGKNINAILDTDKYQDTGQDFFRAITPETPVHEFEQGVVGKDGETVWQRWSIRALFGRNGRPAEYQVVGRDITERKNAEDALRASEEKYRLVVENSNDAIYIYRDNRVFFANRRAEGLAGYTHDELMRINSWDLIHPDDRVRMQQGGSRRIAGENVPSVFSGRIVTKTGDVRNCEFFVNTVLYQGKPAILGIIRDITDRKRAEESVRESEERLQVALSGGNLGTWYWHVRTGEIIVDDRWTEMLGYRREELEPQIGSWERLVHPDDLPGVWDDLNAHLDGRTAFYECEHRILHKSGRWIWVLDKGKVIRRDEKGKPLIAAGTHLDITRRKEAEEALVASEARYRSIFENSVIGIFQVLPDGQFTTANSALAAMFGYESYGQMLAEVKDVGRQLCASNDERAAVFNELMEKGVIESRELQAVRRDGSRFWISLSAQRLKNPDGSTACYEGMVIESTGRHAADDDRVRSETALRESEEKFRRLADNAQDMIYRMTLPDGRYEFISQSSVALTGYAPEEFYADPGLIRTLIHPDSQEYFRKEWEELVNGNLPPFYEYRIIDRTGTTRWVNQRNVLVRDERGRPVAIEGIVTDITRMKEIQQELQRSEQRFLAVSENSGAWVWEVDPDGLYRYSSPAVEKTLGYRPEELVGKLHYYDLFDPPVREQLKEASLAAFQGHEPFRHFINANRHKNGSLVILSTSGTPVFDGNGAFAGYCGVDEDITGRRMVEEALRESDRRQRAFINAASDMAFVKDNTFRYLIVNEAYCRFFNRPEPEILGKTDSDLMPEEMAKNCRISDEEALREDRVVVNIERVRDRVYETRKFPVSMGTFTGIGGFISDITEREQTGNALRESEERFRTLVETSPDMIWEIDPGGNFRYVSPRIRDILGFDPAELTGKPVAVLIPEHARPFVMGEIAKHAGSKAGLFTVEVPARHKDGRDLTIEIRSAPVMGADGRLIGLRGVAHDITLRRNALAALAESEELFRKLIASVPDIVVRTDLSGNIVYINDKGLELADYPSDADMIGTPVFRFFAPEDLPRALENTKLMFSRQLGPVEYQFVTRNGSRYALEINGDVLRSADGKPYGMVYVGRDITGRKKAEEAMKKAHQQLTLLTGITRHDILNNVTVMLGFLSLAKGKSVVPEMTTFIDKLEQKTRQIRTQIEFTRIYEKLGSLEPRWQDIHAVLSGLPALQGIVLSDTCSGTEVYADPLLEKVFFNLTDNSERHGGHVTTIRVTASEKGDCLIITYEDNGIGIPLNEKELIFERGFGKNTGLGLFLAREVLAITGITIAETGEQDRGARFEMTVPKGAFRFSRSVPE